MTDLPTVVSDCELSNSFLSETIQVCIVSRDHKRIMEGMVRLGIGPWRVYHYVDAPGIKDTQYRGEDENFKMTLCLAWTGAMLWEIVEPLEGRTIYNDFLDEHGEGIHHVAFKGGEENGAEMPYDDQIAEFVKRGFPVTQTGLLKEAVQFHYFDTEAATATTFEIYNPKGRDLPEPDEWYPGPPPR
jgi:methylmalonyl-CoA/ethylmalonyl-CoA epimerase